jgi:adenosylmethionine-8-amino-7-oxononanoate aminotransferase
MFYRKTFFDRVKNSVARAVGNKIYLEDGAVFFDFTGGLTSHSIWRWGDTQLAEVIRDQITRYPHLDYKYFYDTNRDELANLLLGSLPPFTAPQNFSVYYPGLSGSDAIEGAVKLSYQFHAANGSSQRKFVISFAESYHGSTMGALSYGDRPNLQLYRELLPTNVVRLPEVNHVRHGLPEDECYANATSSLRQTIERIGAENIACVIGETISGGLTGFVPKPSGYWRAVKELTASYGIHLILDEIICGTGTTGHYYCCEADDVFPDILVLGKTLAGGYFPLNALICRNEIFDVIEVKDGRIQQSNTFQGHSTAVAAAAYIQKKLIGEGLIERAGRVGQQACERIAARLAELELPGQPVGRGLRFSIQFGEGADVFTREVALDVERRHGFLVDGKWHRIAFSPQLTLSDNMIFDCVEKVIESCKLNAKKLEAKSSSKSDPQARWSTA